TGPSYLAMVGLAESRSSSISRGLGQQTFNSKQIHKVANFRRRHALGAELAQAGCLGRLRQFLPAAIEDQAMMPVNRLGQPQQLLQQPMYTRRPEEVATPHYLAYALQRVVND